jgi:hypothetical protein
MGVEPRREIKRQNQEHGEDREVDANGRNPIQRAAVMVRGRILQHRLRKHVVQRLYFWRGQDDIRLPHRIDASNEQKMLSLHGINLRSAKLPTAVQHAFQEPGPYAHGYLFSICLFDI